MHAAVAVGIVIVAVIALAVFAPPSPIVDVPAADAAVAAPSDTNVTVTPPIPPFYQVKVDKPAAPGTLDKVQRVTGAPPGINVWRFIYHSPDINGRDALVSGLYALPATDAPKSGFPLIAYAHGTTGVNQHCGISLTPFQPNTPGFSNFSRQIVPLVKQGYAVVGTDYLGEGAPGDPSYLVGQLEGQNVLDSVRAVHQSQSNIDKSKTVIWGHSQGGHSASFAAQIAPTYAPELQIQGAAVLAPGLLPSLPLAVEGLLAATQPSGQTGFVMLIVASWTKTYPDQVKAEDILTKEGMAKLPLVGQLCGDELSDKFMDHPMSYYVQDPIPAVFYTLASQNTPGAAPIQMPIGMAQGMKDTTIIPQLTLAYNKMLCQKRNTVQFEIYPNDTHPGVVVNSQSFYRQWIADRFNGVPAPNNCTNK